MIRAIKAIYYGLKNFFNLVYMVVTFIPRAIAFLFNGAKTLFQMTSLLPSGIVAIAVMGLGICIIFIIIKAVK